MAFIATAEKAAKVKSQQQVAGKLFHLRLASCPGLTIQVIVFFAVWVCERVEFSEQQGILENPLDGFDQVRLQGVGVLLLGVALVQEGFEGWIVFG